MTPKVGQLKNFSNTSFRLIRHLLREAIGSYNYYGKEISNPTLVGYNHSPNCFDKIRQVN